MPFLLRPEPSAGTFDDVIPRRLERGDIAADGQGRADFLAQLALSLAEAARQLGVSTSGIAKAVARAERPSVH
jgi:hypothetical protein